LSSGASSDSESAIIESARAFVRAEIAPRRGELDREGHFPLEIFERAHRAGFLTAWLPEDLGGEGLELQAMSVLAEEIAYGDAGVATSMFVAFLASCPVLSFGTEEQKNRWLRPLAERPTFASFAWTEPDGSTSLLFRRGGTTARRDGGGYRLRGQKTFITNAPVASWMTVFARNEEGGALNCFIVPTETAGVQITEPHRKLGQRASSTGDVFLEDVLVPSDQRIGSDGEGAQIALDAMSRSRIGVAAMAVGIARAARDRVVDYGHHRRTGSGQRLILQQDYRFRLAEMDLAIEAARLLVRRAGSEAMTGQGELTRWSSMAKLFAADTAVRITGAAVEMLGGQGYTEEGGVEKLMRDAKLLEIYEGPPAIQKILLAEWATRKSG
jgi:acyl-CoA dehydrogenase